MRDPIGVAAVTWRHQISRRRIWNEDWLQKKWSTHGRHPWPTFVWSFLHLNITSHGHLAWARCKTRNGSGFLHHRVVDDSSAAPGGLLLGIRCCRAVAAAPRQVGRDHRLHRKGRGCHCGGGGACTGGWCGACSTGGGGCSSFEPGEVQLLRYWHSFQARNTNPMLVETAWSHQPIVIKLSSRIW